MSAPVTSVLTIDFSRRLADVSRPSEIPTDCTEYWRFAILNDGSLWLGDVRQSHPRNTRDGFYAALSGNTLFISARGYSANLREIVTESMIGWFMKSAGLRCREVRVT